MFYISIKSKITKLFLLFLLLFIIILFFIIHNNSSSKSKSNSIQYKNISSYSQDTQSKTTSTNNSKYKTDIVYVAVSQIGIKSGEKYWSWYGYNNRVDWCACFISWCANECGFIDKEILPKFSSCNSEGITWFKKRNLWVADKDYTPNRGDIIFFDWIDSNSKKQDGIADHVGIVEKCINDFIYTIEGNVKDDSCARKIYYIKDKTILGYGTPEYNKSLVI